MVVQLLERLVNEDGKLVLLAAHSSGGWVATEAALPALHATSRRATGKPGGVIGIFYFGAFVIPVGESVSSFFKPKDGTSVTPPWVEFHVSGPSLFSLQILPGATIANSPCSSFSFGQTQKSGLGTITDGPRFLFNDMDEASAQKWTATLTAQPVLDVKLTNDPYSALPCAYLVLEHDQMLRKKYQEGMVALQSEKSGRSFTMYSAPTSHSPHLSWTDGLVEKLEDFAGKIST